MNVRIVTADDLCHGAQEVLAAALPGLIEALGLNEAQGAEKAYTTPTTWAQVPTLTALQSANLPAGAITSSGIVGAPRKSSLGYDATWRVTVGVFDRGGDYHITARRVRTWAALVRAAVLTAPSLGGVASGVRWVGETYRQYPQAQVARTLGGCAVEFDVDARNVVDLVDLDGGLPVVTSTHPTVNLRPY